MRGGLAFLFVAALGVCAMSFMPGHVRDRAVDGVTIPAQSLRDEAGRQADAFLVWARAGGPIDRESPMDFEPAEEPTQTDI